MVMTMRVTMRVIMATTVMWARTLVLLLLGFDDQFGEFNLLFRCKNDLLHFGRASSSVGLRIRQGVNVLAMAV